MNYIRIFFVICILFSTSVFAIEISTSTGNGADSFVHRYYPGENYGADTLLIVKTDPPQHTNDRKAYVRFDLNDVFGHVSFAQFTLTLNYYSGVHPAIAEYLVYGLNDGHQGEDWAEAGITWSNAPANVTNGDIELIASDVTYLGNFLIFMDQVPSGSAVPFYSPELVAFVNADTNDLVTLIMVRVEESAAGTVFVPKELGSLAPPTLILNGVVGAESQSFSGLKALYR